MSSRVRILFSLIGVLFLISDASAERFFAEYLYIPPAKDAVLRDSTHALPESTVRDVLAHPIPATILNEFNQKSTSVTAFLESAPSHQAALDFYIDSDSTACFSDAFPGKDGNYLFVAAITSKDAFALRLLVDLSGLQPGEALYVLDADGRASFGPFTTQQADPEGTWLPTTLGDTAVLVLTAARPLCPYVRLENVSHFYKSIFNPGTDPPLVCNVPIADETNPDAQALAAGIGILIIPYNTGQAFCTGALLRSLASSASPPEPYLISAWHCFKESTNYSGMEVFWDYRSEEDDPNTLDRNQGAELLAYNASLDAVLLKLNEPVAVGPFGRAWLGWDSLGPDTGDFVQTIHYPRAHSLRTSRGDVTNAVTRVCLNLMCSLAYERQIEVLWEEGVTEPGSSGSPLLNRGRNFRLMGMLSNGPAHSCRTTSGNYDNYGSFSQFFPQVKCHLLHGQSCTEPFMPRTQQCFIARLFGFKEETNNHLRRFRDTVLASSPLGKQLIEDYYALSPLMESWLDSDTLARTAFKGLLQGAAAWGAAVETEPDLNRITGNR